MDLRKRVIAAVKDQGLSRHQAAARFGVAISTAINWVKRFDERGSVAPDKMGGHKPKKIAGGHADWLRERCCEKPFTLQGLVRELADERELKVDYRSVWEFVHAEKLSYKKRRWLPASGACPELDSGIAPMSPAAACNGSNIRD